MKTYLVLLAVALALAGSLAYAEGNGGAWSVSVGAGIRQLETRFESAAPDALNWRGAVSRKSDVGSLELYQQNGVVTYADGAVGIYDYYDGTCSFLADSVGQLGVNPNSYSYYRNPVRQMSFHSDDYSYRAEASGSGMSCEDDDTVVYPYLAVRYGALALGPGRCGALLRYAFLRSDFSSGARNSAEVGVQQTRESYTFAYDVDEAYQWYLPDIASRIPNPGPGGVDGVVWNADWNNSVQTTEEAQDPRVSSSARVSEVARFNAVTRSELDVDQHELVLAPEWRSEAKGRVTWGVAVGPTINLLDCDFQSETRWVDAKSGAAVAAARTADVSDQKLRLGAMAEVSINCALDAQGRYFVEAAGSYHWLDKVDIGTAADKAEFDGSSFDASVGVGIRM